MANHRITVASGVRGLAILDGQYIVDSGDIFVVTETTYASLASSISAGYLIDNGTTTDVPTYEEPEEAAAATGPSLDNLLPSALHRANLHPTYGDDFAGTALDPKWTRRTVAAGNESWEQWGGEGVSWATPAAGWLYTQPAPAGDYEVWAAVAIDSSSVTTLVGPCVLAADGSGRAATVRKDNGYWGVTLAAHVYSAYNNGLADTSVKHSRSIHVVRMKKAGTNYTVMGLPATEAQAGFSSAPSADSAATVWAGTPDRVGMGLFFTDTPPARVWLLRFNVVVL